MTDYKSKYDGKIHEQSKTVNASGLSPMHNLEIEEHNQRRNAEKWQIAKSTKSSFARAMSGDDDTRERITAMGFVVTGENHLFYQVTPPDGWHKSTNGYWTEICDATDTPRMSQFYKGAWYDEDAFVHILTPKETD